MSMVPHGAPNDSLLTRFTVYQIDFSAVASGKRIATTKRRIRWRFGFTNKDALLDGQTGTACRGEEHDVTVVWSITSGKRQITMDGKEVHYSASRGSLLDFSWSVRGNHVMKVVAHASPPLTATPGFRQYDLFIDGQSFFSLPKVYELGIRGGPTSPSAGPRYAGAPDYAVGDGGGGYGGGGYSNYDLPRGGSAYAGSAAPRSAAQEEEELKRAIAESLEESRRHLGRESGLENGGGGYNEPEPPKENGTADLLDFSNEPPAPAPPPALPPAPTQDAQTIVSYQGDNRQYPGVPPGASASYDAMSLTSAPPAYGAAPTQYAVPQLQNGAPPPQQQQYAPQPPAQNQFAPPPAQDQFAPQPAPYAPVDQFAPQADDPFAPKPLPPPSRDDVNSAILGAYTTPGQTTQQQNGTANGYQPGYETPMAPGMPQEAPPQQQPGDVPQLSMNAAFVEPEEEPKSEVESAMAKLVNFDNIDEPAEKEIKLTMQREEEKKKKAKTSALPPAGTGYMGSNATLSQIQEVKPEKPKKDPSEIMAPPPMLFSAGAVNAGALVVHGEGPPPLQRGFGVGVPMQYQQQQQGYAMPQQGMPQQQYYAQQPPPPPQQQYYQNY